MRANPVGDSGDTNTLLLISPITGVSRQQFYLCCHSSSLALWASQWGYEEENQAHTLRQHSYQWSCSSGKDTEIGTQEWARLRLSAGSTCLYITPGTGTSEQKLTCRLSPMKMQQEEREQHFLAWKSSWSHRKKLEKFQRGHWIYSMFCFTPDKVYESVDQCTESESALNSKWYIAFVKTVFKRIN